MDVSPFITSSHFPSREGAWNLAFWIQFESWHWQKWHHMVRKGLIIVVRSPYHLPCPPCKIMRQSRSNGCLTLQYSIPFPMLRGYLKPWILYEIWESTLAEIAWYGPWWDHGCFHKLLPSPSGIYGMLRTTPSAMDVSPCITTSHFPCWEGTHMIWY